MSSIKHFIENLLGEDFLSKSAELVAAHRSLHQIGKVKHKNVTKGFKILGQGNKGYIRSEMPQLDGDVFDEFLAFLQGLGIEVLHSEDRVSELKPAQKHMSTEKIKDLLSKLSEGDDSWTRIPVIVSRDGHILDGHHRWAALRSLGKNSTIKTVHVDVSLDDLIKMAKQFSTGSKSLKE